MTSFTPIDAVRKCAICAGTFTGHGHNADPFPGRCCTDCNALVVLPARFGALFETLRRIHEKLTRAAE